MSCLLPQFKFLPDTFSFHSKFHLHAPTLLLTDRRHIYFQMQCILSRTSTQTSTSTTVLDMEKLELPSLEAHSNLAAADIPCTCVGAIGSRTETTFGASLAKETLLTGEEACTNATAAEAVALAAFARAKAATNVSGDARMMFGRHSSSKFDGKPAVIPSEADSTQLAEIGLVGVELGSTLAKDGLGENCYPTKEADDLEQILDSVAVRSRSHTGRKARREKVAEKAAATYARVKSVCTRPIRRASLLHGQYYDLWGYLNESTSTTRLLTYAEEHELSKGIQDLLKIEKLREELDDDATFAEWAAAAGVDEKTLGYRLDHGIRCKDEMIRSNVGLLVSVAKTFQGPGRDLRELVWVGLLGLEKGAEKFDPRRGKFSTYAPRWIKNAIWKSIYDQSSLIDLPPQLIAAVHKVEEVENRFYGKYGRPPSMVELAKATKLSMKRLQFLLLLLPKAPKSLNQKYEMNQEYGNNKTFERWEAIAAPSVEDLNKLDFKEDLEKVLDTTLKPREKQIISLRFGLDGGRAMSLQEIGDLMNLSRETIRGIESKVFRKLKKSDSFIDLVSYL